MHDLITRFIQYHANGEPTSGDSKPASSSTQEGGGASSAPSPAPTQTGTSETATAPDNAGKSQDVANYTQEQLNAMFAERADRARKSLLKDLGFDDDATLKAALDDLKARKEAELTAAEKLQVELDAATQKAAALEQKLVDAEQQRINDQRDTAIRSAAREAGAVDEEDVLLNILKDSETVKALTKEDGTIQSDAIAQAVKGLQESKAHLFQRQMPGIRSNRDGIPPSPDRKAQEEERIRLQNELRSKGF